ncbi:hypothetical protein APHAL10511_002198 [Amanita phalloides]|nr:hypothetical protein APHAL10511_002198 [Amanita phalloides]
MSISTNHGTLNTTIAVSAIHQEPWEKERIVLILCGLIASGKSTFATQLESHFPQFLRCNQDELGSRRDVERLARQALSNGMSVCIDRTNFDASQRSHWIKIANDFPGTLIWLIVFDIPYEICAARLRERVSHPTIKNAEQGLSILARFASDFRYPQPEEGYDRIMYLTPDQLGPIYSRSDISVILGLVWNSVPVTLTNTPRSLPMPQHDFRQTNSGPKRGNVHSRNNEDGRFVAIPLHWQRAGAGSQGGYYPS